jgi:hypothetical protein
LGFGFAECSEEENPNERPDFGENVGSEKNLFGKALRQGRSPVI